MASRLKFYLFLGIKLTGAALCALLLFIILFGFNLTRYDRTDLVKADAIIVLTGGQDRISAASDLLAQGFAQNLFVSGVGGGAEIEDLIRLVPSLEPYRSCCVSLGREAQNTRGNAVEVEKWAEQSGYHSLIIVTSLAHLPRAMLEFRERMPQIQLQSYRAGPSLSGLMSSNKGLFIRSLTSEAIKFLGAFVRVKGESLF